MAWGDYVPSTRGLNNHYVQGKRASKNEWIASLALNKLGINYTFQYKMWGGIGVRGGVSVDFLCHPWDIPMEIQGEHWHTSSRGADDIIRQHRIESVIGRKVIYLWGQETEDVETAVKRIRELYRAPIV